MRNIYALILTLMSLLTTNFQGSFAVAEPSQPCNLNDFLKTIVSGNKIELTGEPKILQEFDFKDYDSKAVKELIRDAKGAQKASNGDYNNFHYIIDEKNELHLVELPEGSTSATGKTLNSPTLLARNSKTGEVHLIKEYGVMKYDNVNHKPVREVVFQLPEHPETVKEAIKLAEQKVPASSFSRSTVASKNVTQIMKCEAELTKKMKGHGFFVDNLISGNLATAANIGLQAFVFQPLMGWDATDLSTDAGKNTAIADIIALNFNTLLTSRLTKKINYGSLRENPAGRFATTIATDLGVNFMVKKPIYRCTNGILTACNSTSCGSDWVSCAKDVMTKNKHLKTGDDLIAAIADLYSSSGCHVEDTQKHVSYSSNHIKRIEDAPLCRTEKDHNFQSWYINQVWKYESIYGATQYFPKFVTEAWIANQLPIEVFKWCLLDRKAQFLVNPWAVRFYSKMGYGLAYYSGRQLYRDSKKSEWEQMTEAERNAAIRAMEGSVEYLPQR